MVMNSILPTARGKVFNPDGVLFSSEVKKEFKCEILKYHPDKLGDLELIDKYRAFAEHFENLSN